MHVRRALTITVLVCLFAPVPRAHSQETSIEGRLLSLINGGRGPNLLPHTGLQVAARSHSKSLSSRGSLTHSGARGRISGASPDPAEENGGSDDGYSGTWCENVAFVSGGSASRVAKRIYDGWTNSSGHRTCMNDPKMNAAGVGVYFDGDTWWATLELMKDNSPPTGKPVEPPPTPTPSPTPEPTASIGGADTTTPVPVRVVEIPVAGKVDTRGQQVSVGWQEFVGLLLAAAVGVLLLLAMLRSLRARGGSGTT